MKNLKYLLIVAFSGLVLIFNSCNKDDDTTKDCPDTDPTIIFLSGTGSKTYLNIEGKVYATGGSISDRGVCWSTFEHPSISDFCIHSGSGDGTYTCTMGNLNPNTTYYVSLFAETCNGICYLELSPMTTSANETLPSVITKEVINITSMNAICGGNVTDDGNCAVTARGVCLNKAGSPTITGNDGYTVDGSGTGNYTSSLLALASDQTYYIRAYATNCNGTAYGNEKVFKTDKRKIYVSITNLNVNSGDEPSVSIHSNGADFKIVELNSTEYFEIDFTTSPKLYIWTCPTNSSCYWKPYNVPSYVGGSMYYYEGSRAIRINRNHGK